LVLLVGFFAAQRRASVIAFAVAGAVFVVLHAVLLFFLSDMGKAWGGNGDRILIAGGGIIMLCGALAVPVFISCKLPKAREAGPPDNARTAAAFIALFLIVFLVSSALHAISYPMAAMLGHPRTWLIVIGGAAAAWGLRHHYRWAWWLAMAGCSWELFRFLQRLVVYPTGAGPAILSESGLMALLQIIVVTLLLGKRTRDACVR
jgi:hypothetical protein